MEHLAYRCATAAAAALAVGGLVAALTPMTQSLPDVQIRDFDLATSAAANVDPGPLVDITENHVRPDLPGTGDTDLPHSTLGDQLFGNGDGELGDGSTFSIGDLENELRALLDGSGGFDPQSVPGVVPPDADLGGVAGPSVSGFSGGEQGAGSAAATASLAGMAFMQGLPAAYQTFTGAVAAMESQLNSSLVAAQMAAADQLFGDNPDVNVVVNWIYTVNNTLLAQNESAFNSIFGIPFDAHASLLGHLDPGAADADWGTVLGFSPEEFNEIVQALQADNVSLLSSIDWASWFSGLF